MCYTIGFKTKYWIGSGYNKKNVNFVNNMQMYMCNISSGVTLRGPQGFFYLCVEKDGGVRSTAQ